ncbi:MAG: sulfotransferase [bacterium]
MQWVKPFLVLGIQRSGTSLLAAYLGNHPDINMLLESKKKNVLNKPYGRPLTGNKLLTIQIDYEKRANWLTNKINYVARKLFTTQKGTWYRRLFPQSELSIKDYYVMNPKIIVIYRKREQVIASMKKRSGYDYKRANKEFRDGISLLDKVIQNLNPLIVEYGFLCKSRSRIKAML